VRITVLTIALLGFGSQLSTAEESSASKQYKKLLDEYESEGGARLFAKRFMQFAELNSQDPTAVDALLWVVEKVRGKSDTIKALEILAKDHIRSERLGPACQTIANSRSVAAERLLRAVIDNNPDKVGQAQACFYLAALLDREADLVEQLKAEPELAPRVLQYYGNEYGQHLTSLGSKQLTKKREQVYERLQKSFADVGIQDSTMGKIAESRLFAIRHLSVGSLAPEIKGEDIHGKPLKLSDYRGKIVMLSFWGHW
jgi:hypothetical protein